MIFEIIDISWEISTYYDIEKSLYRNSNKWCLHNDKTGVFLTFLTHSIFTYDSYPFSFTMEVMKILSPSSRIVSNFIWRM